MSLKVRLINKTKQQLNIDMVRIDIDMVRIDEGIVLKEGRTLSLWKLNAMSSLISKQRKAFLGQAAPVGYVPGLGRG